MTDSAKKEEIRSRSYEMVERYLSNLGTYPTSSGIPMSEHMKEIEMYCSSLDEDEADYFNSIYCAQFDIADEEAESKRKHMQRVSADLYNALQQQSDSQHHSTVHEGLRGSLNAKMTCPHCGQRGGVQTQQVTRKKGISGGKATAALFTAGLTLFATGLSRKEQQTKAYCANCGNTWFF